MRREVKEETGLDIAIKRLLYICDRLEDAHHVVHITFLLQRTSGELVVGREPEPDANEILAAEFVPIGDLQSRGFSAFSAEFQGIVEAGFPDSGSYKGPTRNIGL